MNTSTLDGFQYFESDSVDNIRSLFFNFYENKNLPLLIQNSKIIRELFFEFIQSNDFEKEYIILGGELCKHFNISKELFVLQVSPTPRVFIPGAHGTSLHCDYWYGHGVTFYTVWIPIIGLNEKSSFNMVASNEENSRILTKIKNNHSLLENINKITMKSFNVLPEKNQAAIFSSKLLHKSINNSSHEIRISLDFRFGQKNDNSSTKNLNNWYKYQDDKLSRECKNKNNFLKYIIDGRPIETGVQHILIENLSNKNGIELSAQEAEIERFGYPMLKMHCRAIANNNSPFNGIVIANKTLIDYKTLKYILNINVPIFDSLEEKWL